MPDRPRVCVVGAGAVGGHFAVRLARIGCPTSVVVRGAALEAIRASGLTLHSRGEVLHADVRADDDPAALGPQDLVLVTTKATALDAIAPRLAPLLTPSTLVVFAQNGVPWWFDGVAGIAPALAALKTAGQVIGGVILSSNHVERPGVVVHGSPKANALRVGEIDCRPTARIAALRALLREAGIDSPDDDDIRRAVWRKLLMNVAGAPVAVLTRREGAITTLDPALAQVYDRLVHETVAIAASQGVVFAPEEADPAPMRALANTQHKASMLQDFELGRPLETEAILRRPQAFARAAGLATPVLDTVTAFVERLVIDRDAAAR